MVVEILKDDERFKIKAGQLFEAKRYWLDPTSKVTLLRRLTKKDRKPIGKDPECNQYLSNVRML
jgi:hypothetical protein